MGKTITDCGDAALPLICHSLSKERRRLDAPEMEIPSAIIETGKSASPGPFQHSKIFEAVPKLSKLSRNQSNLNAIATFNHNTNLLHILQHLIPVPNRSELLRQSHEEIRHLRQDLVPGQDTSSCPLGKAHTACQFASHRGRPSPQRPGRNFFASSPQS